MLLSLALIHVAMAAGASPPTFYGDVGPILRDHCVSCHSPGQIAPMSLRTYEEARPWAKSILREVVAKRMPPFAGAGPIGHYKDDPRLTDEQIETISDWVNGRLLEGEAPEDGWNAPDVPLLGEWPEGPPDIVISLPEYVAKDTNEATPWSFSDHVFEEDTYVRATSWRVDNPKLPHHIGMFLISKRVPVPEEGQLNSFEEIDLRNADVFFTSPEFLYTPGTTPNQVPDGWATLIPKGMRFLITAHYGPGEPGERAQCELGLYLANGFVRPMETPLGPGHWDFTIPAGDPNYTLTGALPFSNHGLIEGFFVHMHYRGKSARFYLKHADESRELVMEIPKYDFNWQRSYWLAEPIAVEAGTLLEFEAVWDNSAGNPYNPDPTVEVKTGQSTNDEMMGGAAYWRRTDFTTPPVLVRHGHRVDLAELISK